MANRRLDVGQQDVVVDQGRAMTHLHKQILGHHAYPSGSYAQEGRWLSCKRFCVMRVPCASQSHQIPIVQLMDMIAPHDHIDGRMQLDSGDLRSAKLHHVVDMMDVVVLDQAEHTAHPADDAALLAVMDVVAADDVASHLLLQPAVILPSAHRVPLHLGRAFDILL